MNRLIFALVSATLILCGCGSSGGSSTTAAPGTAAKTSPAPNHSHLSVDATPVFARPSTSAPVLSGLVKVAYENFAINPDVVRVKAGSTIEWTNHDPTDHNVTSQSGPQHFASKNFGEGASFRVHLTHPGIYHYECTLHPATMNGTIQVLS